MIDREKLVSLAPRCSWPEAIRCGPGWSGPLERFAGALAKAGAEAAFDEIGNRAGAMVVSYRARTPAVEKAVESLVDECAFACERCGRRGLPAMSRHGWTVRCAPCRPGHPRGRKKVGGV